MAKGEISWVRVNEEGLKLQVYARRIGTQWNFYVREKRFYDWQDLERPPLEDWLELLDGVRRRARRRLVRPEEIGRIERIIRERFPEGKL
jgi:hypothetical protein